MLMQALDTFIGLVSVFLILSLIVSALGEGVSSWLNFRGNVLKRSISTLLDDGSANRFFQHEAIRRLMRGNRLPSYIPDKVIAEVIVDLVVDPPKSPCRTCRPPEKKPITPNTVDQALRDLDQRYAPALKERWQRAECDVERFKSLIADWFNLTGDRSTGWFRRRLSLALFSVGLAVAMALNADTLYMFNALSNDASLRQSFVDYATELVDKARADEIRCEDEACRDLVRRFAGEGANDPIKVDALTAEQRSKLAGLCGQPADPPDMEACRENLANRLDEQQQICRALGVEGDCTLRKLVSDALPVATPLLGFDLLREEIEELSAEEKPEFWLLKVIGWVLTAAAVSLGAPFWFDLLQKFVHIRGSVKAVASTPATPQTQQMQEPSIAPVPRARAVIRTASTDEAALDELTHFDAKTFGFSPLNLLWSARFSKLAYAADRTIIEAQLVDWGADGTLLEHEESQCIVARTPRAAFVSFRGSENKVEDWVTNVQVALKKPGWNPQAGYEVHSGFDKALENVWSDSQGFEGIISKLGEMGVFEQGIPIWLSGHSLGGALAALGSLRLADHLAQHDRKNIVGGIHTFGQPRVGDPACAAAFESAFPARYFRSVNNRDIAPRVPIPRTPDIQELFRARQAAGETTLELLDYRHAGRVIYFNDTGKAMMDPPLWYRRLDTLAVGVTQEEIKKAASETVGDHDIDKYVSLHRAMLEVVANEPAVA